MVLDAISYDWKSLIIFLDAIGKRGGPGIGLFRTGVRTGGRVNTSIPQATKKTLYNRWDTKIKMLDRDKDGKNTNLKALKLDRRFIKDWIS
jgi:hypothetical protein